MAPLLCFSPGLSARPCLQLLLLCQGRLTSLRKALLLLGKAGFVEAFGQHTMLFGPEKSLRKTNLNILK
jgi:hypothetical protein